MKETICKIKNLIKFYLHNFIAFEVTTSKAEVIQKWFVKILMSLLLFSELKNKQKKLKQLTPFENRNYLSVLNSNHEYDNSPMKIWSFLFDLFRISILILKSEKIKVGEKPEVNCFQDFKFEESE